MKLIKTTMIGTLAASILAAVLATSAQAKHYDPCPGAPEIASASSEDCRKALGFELAGSPWRGHQGRFRNTFYQPKPDRLPPIKIGRIYDVYPDGTVVFR